MNHVTIIILGGFLARLAAEADLVTTTLERVRAVEQALGKGPDTFGLIHADLHYDNLLLAHNTVRAIDFDDWVSARCSMTRR